ncbi:GntR family transcriptional regulator [Scopulibacillus cellulosilyticus]|uniref:GntR family transcriptional regulator n=1 Tax=Scopulibacillus cellulosilyticus TaxID=2665665 RepID=A0ABW2PUH6_9BACL
MVQILPTKSRIKGSTRDFVYQEIKNQIINLELTPGEKILEKEIAEKLEVSRTPVREAFLKLAEEELIGIYPQSGTVVSKIDLDLVEEARFVRENIEKAVVKIACVQLNESDLFLFKKNLALQELCLSKDTYQQLFKLDKEFHKILFESVGKSGIWKIVNKMNSHFDRLRLLRLTVNTDWELLVSQHKEIFQAIVEKNEKLAGDLMEKHLKLVNFEKEEIKATYPEYFNQN